MKKVRIPNFTGPFLYRGFLAVVGPAKSGKSSLVSVIGNNLWRRMNATGTLVINGRTMEDTWVKPTFLSSTDLPMEGISVEQALIYTGIDSLYTQILFGSKHDFPSRVLVKGQF